MYGRDKTVLVGLIQIGSELCFLNYNIIVKHSSASQMVCFYIPAWVTLCMTLTLTTGVSMLDNMILPSQTHMSSTMVLRELSSIPGTISPPYNTTSPSSSRLNQLCKFLIGYHMSILLSIHYIQSVTLCFSLA